MFMILIEIVYDINDLLTELQRFTEPVNVQ